MSKQIVNPELWLTTAGWPDVIDMRIIPAFLLFTLASAAITAERIDSLPEVLAQHQKAMGKPLKSVKVDLLIEEPSFSVSARYLANRDPAMRIDVFADGERVFSEGLDGKLAWQWPADLDKPVPASADGAAALLRGVYNNLFGLHERRDLGYSLHYDGVEYIDNKPFWKVTSIAPDGFKESYFINTGTALIERKEEWVALHPDQDDTRVSMVTDYFDYRWLGNHRLSFGSRKRNSVSNEVLAEVIIEKVEVNPVLAKSAFAADPGQALLSR